MPYTPIPYSLPNRSEEHMLAAAKALHLLMRQRRSCRDFSDRVVPRELIESLIAVAHTAPSGANRQPWRFVAVDDPVIKSEIRAAAEQEERESYAKRMPQKWLDAIEPLGTDAHKPFLETAPWLVAVFQVTWEWEGDQKQPNYYPVESVGLATGLFLTACHMVGLATLTHTPSPMKFLRKILRRPVNERPFLLIPVGYPARGCMVPKIDKKPLAEVVQWNCPAPERHPQR